MVDRDIIFVLGHGRSGTSAITRVLSLCGATLPQSVLAATSFNPRGLWEPVAAWKLDLDILASISSIPKDRADIEELEIEGREKEIYIGRIQDFLSTCPVARTLVLKFYPDSIRLWIEAAHRSDFGVKVVIIFRHPEETFASFRALSTSKATPIESLTYSGLGHICYQTATLVTYRASSWSTRASSETGESRSLVCRKS